jgi:hypothetical protein
MQSEDRTVPASPQVGNVFLPKPLKSTSIYSFTLVAKCRLSQVSRSVNVFLKLLCADIFATVHPDRFTNHTVGILASNQNGLFHPPEACP